MQIIKKKKKKKKRNKVNVKNVTDGEKSWKVKSKDSPLTIN